MAQASNKNYSFLSVVSQTFWNIRRIADVPKTDFYPSPEVNGRVLEFQIKNNKFNLSEDSFLKFVKKCFSFKRKMMFKQIDVSSPETVKKFLAN